MEAQKMTNNWLVRTFLALAVSASAWAPALAQDTYPNKPIRLIVPFVAGGGGDILARMVMNRVATELGQPIIFENLAGAGGNVGSMAGTRASNDGYTLLYGTNGTLAINQTLYKKPGFDPLVDLQPVGQLTRIAAMVVVRPGLPVTSMADLVKLLKANPGKFTFASAGNGTTSHLAGEILKASTGAAVVHIPYRGGAPAMTDVVGGQVDMMIDVMPNTVPQVKSGRLRGLAVTTATRVSTWPDMPTVAESGVKDFDVSAWDAIMAPAGTPPAVINRLNAAIRAALSDPELRKQLLDRGSEVATGTPQALGAFVKTEIERWGQAVKGSAAQVD